MPAGNLKNTLYQLALPFLGLRSPISSVQGGTEKENARKPHEYTVSGRFYWSE